MKAFCEYQLRESKPVSFLDWILPIMVFAGVISVIALIISI